MLALPTARFTPVSRLLTARRLRALTGSFSLLLAPYATHAANATWQGGPAGDWSNAANWSPSTFVPNNGNGGQTYSANLTSTSVALTEAIAIDGLSVSDTILSGNTTLTTGSLGTSLSGNNTLSSGLTLGVTGPFAFANDSASLTNSGTLRFDTPAPDVLSFPSPFYTTSNATLINAADGLIRFHPFSNTSVGDVFTSPFSLINHGTILADNGTSNSLFTPLTQSATGLIRATSNSTLILRSGGTLAGTLQPDADSALILTGNAFFAFVLDGSYTLDQATATGGGLIEASYTNITGSLAAGTLSLSSTAITGIFVNEAPSTLLWNGNTGFANDSASLTNHGSLQFGGSFSTPSNATLTNSATGLIRFKPSYGGVYVGNSSSSPFALANAGTVLADNGQHNYLDTPVTQSASGLLRATSASLLSLRFGGTLAGTIQADANSTVRLRGNGKTYNLNQLAATGTGFVSAHDANLTGSVSSGSLSLFDAMLTGAFVNGSFATLMWNSGTRFAAPSASLTNQGTLQFNPIAVGGFTSSSATLTNSAAGLIRFSPSNATDVGGNSTSPFVLVNHGAILADNGKANSLFTPPTQSTSGILRATANSSLVLQSGGILAGALQADIGSTIKLSGVGRSYSLNQASTIGSGSVEASDTNLTGSLASGSLGLFGTTFTGSFVNESPATLLWNSYTGFANDAASLTNHGTLQFNGTSSFGYPSNATLTNSSTGIIRFDPSVSISGGDSSYPPFALANSGTVLADNGHTNSLSAPVTQSATGLIRATSNSSLSLQSGGTIAGTLQADITSTVRLSGYGRTYSLNQASTIGGGVIEAYATNLTGSLASGSLGLFDTALTGSFVNEAPATLLWHSYTRFANDSAALTNHGILQFGTHSTSLTSYSSNATLINSSTGLIRFNPASGTAVGDSYTSPFALAHSGTILADNGQFNSLHAPLTQSATGLIRATSASALYLGSGGILAGTLQADANSTVRLYGSEKTYTLDQLASTGSGIVGAYSTTLTGSLASGTLSLDDTALTGSFTNQGPSTLHWRSYTLFASDSASLTNHGTLQFGNSEANSVHRAYSSSNATLTNSATGLIRFHPTSGTSVGDSVTSPFRLANAGTVLADNGKINSLYAPFNNTGLVRVTSGSSFSLAGAFTQTAGEVRVENATLSADFGQTLAFQGGMLRASGSISANLSLANTGFEIGTSQTAGSLSLSGNLTLLAGTSATFDLNGLAPGTGYDSLAVNGGVTFGGDLTIRLSASLAATLTPGDTFTLVSATSVSGAFANIQSGQRLTLPNGAGSFLVTLSGAALTLSDFSPPPPAFESFLIAASVPIHQRGPTDDPDADGVPNLLEFALGGAPLVPDPAILPIAELIGPKLALTYVRAESAAVSYSVETTTDLSTPASWTPIGVTQGTPAPDGRTTATIPLGTGPRFLRLHVTLNP